MAGAGCLMTSWAACVWTRMHGSSTSPDSNVFHRTPKERERERERLKRKKLNTWSESKILWRRPFYLHFTWIKEQNELLFLVSSPSPPRWRHWPDLCGRREIALTTRSAFYEFLLNFMFGAGLRWKAIFSRKFSIC